MRQQHQLVQVLITCAVASLRMMRADHDPVLSPADADVFSRKVVVPTRINQAKNREKCVSVIERLQNDVVWFIDGEDKVDDVPTNDRERTGEEIDRTFFRAEKRIKFRFTTSSPFKMFDSTDVQKLLRGQRFLFIGNSMMNRLTQSLVIMYRCCPDAPPTPSNNQRYWYDQRTYKNSNYGHGSYYYVVPRNAEAFDMTRSFGNATSSYMNQGLLDFEKQPISTCPNGTEIPGIPETRYSVDCDMIGGSARAMEEKGNVLLAFKYTNTPVLNVEQWLLEKLHTPPKAPEMAYRCAQDEVNVVVVQSPDHDDDFLKLVDTISKVIAYDEARGLSMKKRWFIYGRTYRTYNGENSREFRHDRHKANERTVLRSRIARNAGLYYVPLYKKELVGVRSFGVAHEDNNHWHFKDVGQHFVTQIFLNALQMSVLCD